MSRGGAGPDDEPVVELLESESDEAGASERIRTFVVRSGALAWLGRHRSVVGGVTALVLVSAGITAYVATRPPPADPVVAVIIQGFSSGGMDFDEQGRARAVQSYQVSTVVPGDVVVPVGVVGPGLTTPTSTIPPVHPGLPGLGDLGATVECTDDRWWGSHEADYGIRVVRTDAYDRVVTYDAPLPTGGVGASAERWATSVRQLCLDTLVRSLPPAKAELTAEASNGQFEGRLMVRNTSGHRIRLQVADYSDGRAEQHAGPGRDVPPGATGTLHFSVTATNCDAGEPRLPTPTDLLAQGPGTGHAIAVLIDDPNATTHGGSADAKFLSWVTLDATSAKTLDKEWAGLCRGGPVPTRSFAPHAPGVAVRGATGHAVDREKPGRAHVSNE